MSTARAFAHPMRNVEAIAAPPGSIAVDIGAGSGHYSMALAREVGPEGKVYAIDVQPDLLRRITNEARLRGYTQVHTVHGDVERPHGTKLRSRTADLVIMSNILFQLHEPQAALEEARRILKLGGRLVVIDWVGGLRGPGAIAKRHLYSRQQALHDAREAHFEYVGNFDAGSHHYGLIFSPL